MTLLLTLDDGATRQVLTEAVGIARAAAVEEAGAEQVGEHAGVEHEDAVCLTHRFDAHVPGYRGWHWSVTVATAGEGAPVTVSEVVLRPGPEALVAPKWVPWDRRVRAGDLGVGDIFPAADDDERLAPAYLASDDPEVEEVAYEFGFGRVRVMSRYGRQDAAARWSDGEFGPRSDMARGAPDVCGTCGFYVELGGSLRAAFGVCGNDIAPADGHVVHAEYGCGAHSEVTVDISSSVPVAELVYDDSLLDTEPAPEAPERAEAAAENATTGTEGTSAEADGTQGADVEGAGAEGAEAVAAAPAERPEALPAEQPVPDADKAGTVPEPPEAPVEQASAEVATPSETTVRETTTAPEATAPEATAPEATAPETTAPETTVTAEAPAVPPAVPDTDPPAAGTTGTAAPDSADEAATPDSVNPGSADDAVTPASAAPATAADGETDETTPGDRAES
ncbi:hypothetical protein CFN78_24460 [Amycolatopsis antarctica]|uniref:DUF3027 domain-containing protein n=1 Tax=Amycolatopsis antarctica TaxID=1854586 RepID=A0A263CWP0_9PSEU|nr:DUF3027 domain-containing protein [Amycolatopsis antarctica]OZM70560.1 hypothetical protein CFN78_24460 [Amycolatopsis antarctica]